MRLPNYQDAKKRTKEKVEFIYLNDEYQKIFNEKKFFLRTYGCQMNVHDSEAIRSYLETLGFTSVETLEEADLVILNTCAIRENAHDKVFGFLGRCKHLKKEKPELIIAIGGCMAQEEGVVNEIMKKHPYVDIVFGTHNIHELPKLIIDRTKKQQIEVFSNEGNVFENIPYSRDSKITAWVNIMYGCDKFCTYCIVPYTRGKQRSRKSEDIIEEVRELYNNGYQEVTLLGQNVNAYGKDFESEYDFADLLGEVSQTGIPRIRFVTSHPWDFTDKMIDVISKCDNIMPYIHLPIQSGSDRILKLMGRKYTRESYLELVKELKENIPNICLTTDIIVGFPNETEEDFLDTLSIVNECKYDSAFTFIYSPRVGTPAAKMEDNIPLSVKEERLQRLNELVNKYSREANEKLFNKTVPVLIDGKSEKEGMLSGYTDTNKLVNVKLDESYIGKIVNVKITDVKTWSLDGVLDE